MREPIKALCVVCLAMEGEEVEAKPVPPGKPGPYCSGCLAGFAEDDHREAHWDPDLGGER